ncbi:MAG: hypothetical protein KDA51_18845 [Planctomycetales bacterium]|nr:hypothetical protein [Planctomycetales bacterium]
MKRSKPAARKLDATRDGRSLHTSLLRILPAILCSTGFLSAVVAKDPPLSLHPDNPHYFLWRGQPTVLITSAEHYGAVLNLDYSFVAGHEGGDFEYPATQPGGGNPGFRQQMTVLRDFINSFDFVRMHPNTEFMSGGVPEKMQVYPLAEAGQQYAAYFVEADNLAQQSFSLTVDLPAGEYDIEWIDVLSGQSTHGERVKSPDTKTIHSPKFQREIALSIRR